MEILRAANAEIAMRRILQAAVSEKASDVHLEPCREFVLVRFRIDGTLTERYRLPPDMAAGLSVRAKVLGGMDVGENRIPQDGSFSEIRDERNTDFRLSVMPSVYGETIVIRILSGQVDFIEKNELGMLPLQKKIFRTKIGKKSGMILTTGPTGSGKTSTLYAALKLVCRPEISVISVEDPVEYRIPGITQVEVNEKAGLTFEKGLRSLVRQDPDVVMIGEIRDRETAEIAVHAALTGTSCPVYASYERCRIGACPPDRYGHSAVPAFRVAVPHHFSKACEETLSRLPEGNGHYKRNGGRKVIS